MTRLLLTLTVASLFSGCTWVQVTSAGDNVRLATSAEVGNCNRIGRTHAKTLSRVVLVERGVETLQEELLSLARNEAADMGGNTVVPESVIEDGRQTFGVYNCP